MGDIVMRNEVLITIRAQKVNFIPRCSYNKHRCFSLLFGPKKSVNSTWEPEEDIISSIAFQLHYVPISSF